MNLSQHEMQAIHRMMASHCKHVTLGMQEGVLIGDVRGIAHYHAGGKDGRGAWLIGDAVIGHCPFCGKVLPTHGESEKEYSTPINSPMHIFMSSSADYQPKKYDPDEEDY